MSQEIQKFAKHRIVTYIIAFLIIAVNLWIVNTYGLTEDASPEVTITLVAIVTFFGVMVMSAHHNHDTDEAQRKHSTGTMRRAIAGFVIIVYLIAFSMITFGDFQDKTIEGASTSMANEMYEKINKLSDKSDSAQLAQIVNSTLSQNIPDIQSQLESQLLTKDTMLGHFTTVTSLVIAFYFGSKAVENWHTNKNSPNKEWIKDKIDKANKEDDDVQKKKILDDLSSSLK